MVGGAVELDAGRGQPAQRVGQSGAIGIAHGDVVETRVPGRRRRAAERLPGVEPDVVVVAAGADERSLLAVARLELEPEHTAPESERALEVGHLQVDVADVDAWIDRHDR